MDFQELLDHADYNTAESKYKGNSVRYSSVLPPPKKPPKNAVQSDSVRRFLEKKKKEEEAKAAEAQKQKEQLLALRAQNSKNNKKAKIMASRTKDNDFSKIKLTDDEIEAKKKIQQALVRKNLADKKERMKARIEMEEKEKLLPRKRKRKTKNGELIERTEDLDHDDDDHHEVLIQTNSSSKSYDKNISGKSNSVRKPTRPPPSNLSFSELLKIAETKQHEPMDIVIPKKEEEKLLTKKEKKIREEELARQRRKQEKLLQGKSSSQLSNSPQTISPNQKKVSEKSENKKPYVIHVEKDKSIQDSSKFKIPNKTVSVPSNKNIPVKHKDSNFNSNLSQHNLSSSNKHTKGSLMNGQKKDKFHEESSSSKETDVRKKNIVPKKNGIKINPVQAPPIKQANPQPKFDEEAFKASIEKQMREKIEKEIAKGIEEKLAATLAQFQALQQPKPPELPKPVKKETVVKTATVNSVKKVPEKPKMNTKEIERMNSVKKQILEQRSMKPKLPEKKPFHTNPYLDPPRRLLEPRRPPRPPVKRRIESDDDEEDDDDDMSDFIDDGPSQNEEDYSKYIKEIFNYDRSRYDDDDDDDVMESSFAEQMKEEVQSAKLGYLEDLEEEKKERERERLKKMKRKK